MGYYDYRRLVEHLYWRHGTVSVSCAECNLRRWHFAEHRCHVLPIFRTFHDDGDEKAEQKNTITARESPYCLCGKIKDDTPMIGCDAPGCPLEWYHFECVGVTIPPEGDWICPECTYREAKKKKKIKTSHDDDDAYYPPCKKRAPSNNKY